MLLKLPPLNDTELPPIEIKKSLTLIGSNGSGKTRMSIWIDDNNADLKIHRISAQKSLKMPNNVALSSLATTSEKFIYGTEKTFNQDHLSWWEKEGKANSRWGNAPATHLLDDFKLLMEYLMTEHAQKSIEFRNLRMNGDSSFINETRLEKIKAIWEKIISHRSLEILSGAIEVSDSSSTPYNGSQMSDGERSIFYFIGTVLSAPPDSLIIIDEPESHLHHAILNKLWNAIEALREDCSFLYITHNLDFAYSRKDSQIIWVKSYDNSSWDYELLDNDNPPDPLKLQILGSRQQVLLIEGDSTKSIDAKLYPTLYPEYNVISLGSCNAVIHYTKAYKNQTLSGIHHANVIGIIDRDRRSAHEIQEYRNNNIYVPEVAEIENLFLLPEVIHIVATLLNFSNQVETITSEVKANVFRFLEQEKNNQALLFTSQVSRNLIIQSLDVKNSTIEEHLKVINSLPNALSSIEDTYRNFISKIETIIDHKDYLEALKIINNKGIIARSNICSLLGLGKKSDYINYVIRLLNDRNQNLIEVFKKYIPLE